MLISVVEIVCLHLSKWQSYELLKHKVSAINHNCKKSQVKICLPFYITADGVISNFRTDPLNQFCSWMMKTLTDCDYEPGEPVDYATLIIYYQSISQKMTLLNFFLLFLQYTYKYLYNVPGLCHFSCLR